MLASGRSKLSPVFSETASC